MGRVWAQYGIVTIMKPFLKRVLMSFPRARESISTGRSSSMVAYPHTRMSWGAIPGSL